MDPVRVQELLVALMGAGAVWYLGRRMLRSISRFRRLTSGAPDLPGKAGGCRRCK